MTRSEERKRAAELKAVDVRVLIKASVPEVLGQLTAFHVDQLQRVLDVAAINADIENRGSALDQQSIKGKIVHSNQYLRNPAVVAQRDRILTQKIALKPGENAIRLDLHRLLMPDALKPTSDNPDEAAYLLVVADVYIHRGVWLVLDSSAGAMTQRISATDPRKWRVRLLLGYSPGAVVEEIDASAGKLTRKGLLSPTRIRAGYAEWVNFGPTMKGLERALDQVRSQITKGRDEHVWWSAHRDDFPVVSKISDFVGRADWPDEGIWNQPHQIRLEAAQLVSEGKLNEASKFALLAAYQAQWCARAVGEYIEATLSGASRVKSILEVAVVVGQIAEAILTLLFVGQGVFRLLTRKGATLALEGGAQRQLPAGGGQLQLPAGGQTTPVTVPRAPAPAPAFKPSLSGTNPSVSSRVPGSGGGSSNGGASNAVTELQINMNHVRHELGMPAVTQPGRVALAQDAQFKRHLKEYMDYFQSELKALKARNPKWTREEVEAIIDRADARFGGWMPGD